MEHGGETTGGDSLNPREESVETKPNAKAETEVASNDDEKIYPPMKKVMPAMLAIYSVFFLVALV